MTFASILALLGLALLDALNPFSIAALAYLLGTDRPLARGGVFVAASFLAYLTGGIVLLEGWLAVIQRLLPLLPDWTLPAIELVAAAACAAFAWRALKPGGTSHAFRPPLQLGLVATFIFGVANTLADLPTAFPLFAAVSQIAVLEGGFLVHFAWLAVYVAVYVGPLLAMMVVQRLAGQRADFLFGRVRAGVDWTLTTILPLLLATAALFLIWDGLRRLIA